MSSPLSPSAFAVRVVLSHRVRNAEGGWHWQPVAAQDQIRVTKNRGKVLRFSVDSPLPYRPTDVQVYLADYEDTAPAGAVTLASLPGVRLSKDGLSLQSISEPVKAIPNQLPETASYMSEVIAKLTKISRQLQVYVVINTNTNELVGCSVEFQTHNTGKKTSKGEWELNPAPPPHQLKPLLPQQPHPPQQPYRQHAAGNTSPTGHASGAQGHSPASSSPSYSSHPSPDYQSPTGGTTSPPPYPRQPAPQQQQQQQQQQHRYNYGQHPQPAHPAVQPQQQSSFIPVAQYLQQQQQKQQQHTAPGLQRQPVWHQYQYNQRHELQKQQETALWTTSAPAAQQHQPQQQQHFKFHQSAAGAAAAANAATPVIQAFPQSGAVPSRVVLHRQPSAQAVHGQPPPPQQHYNPHPQHQQSTAYAAQSPAQQQQQRRASLLYHQSPVHSSDWAASSVAGPFDASAAAYPSSGFIASLMRVDSTGQAALGSLASSSSSLSSSSTGSSGYDSSDGLLQGKRMRGDDGSRIRTSDPVNQATGDSDDSSDGENDFHQHPEAVEARPGGMSVRTGLHVKGLVRAQAFLHYSDLRLKTSVEDVVDAIQTLSQLEGKRYTWRNDVAGSPINGGSAQVSEIDREIAYLRKYVDIDADDGSDQEPDQEPTGIKVLGLIAQEVQRVLPEIVQESADGWLSIDYAEIVPILIEAFKEHMQAYHRMQAGFRDEFETFKDQLRERRDKLGADLASHESGEESDPDSPRGGKAHGAVDNGADLSDGAVDTDDDDHDDGADECGFELEEIPETRPLARLNFRSKLDVKELAERMSSLIPPRPYNELLHTLRTDKRKRQTKQRSYGIAFFSVGTFLLVVNALLAASIPIFVFHLGTANKGTGALLYDYSVNTDRSYTVSVLGNVVSVQGTSGSSSSSSASASSLSSSPTSLPSTLGKRNRATPFDEGLTPVKGASSSSSSSTYYAERDALRPPPTGRPNDQITCRMLSGDGSDNLIFQAEFSWSLADPHGGYLSVNYIVEILHIIEYEEEDGYAGYQRGEERFIFGNSTGKEAVWDSWNVLNRTQNDTKIQNWHAYTKDSIFLVHGSVSERQVVDQRFGHNLTSNSIRVDLIINDFPFTQPNTTLALVMRIRSKDPMVLVTAPVPTYQAGSYTTQIGGGSGGSGGNTKASPSPSRGPDVGDNDEDLVDAFSGTEGNLGGHTAERLEGGQTRLVPPPPSWVHQRVVVDKVGNGTITGNVQGVFDWPLLVTHGPNITDTLVVTGGEQSMVIAERLLGDELDFNEPPSGSLAPKELSRVFSFSFYEAPQSSVYRWSINIGVDNIT